MHPERNEADLPVNTQSNRPFLLGNPGDESLTSSEQGTTLRRPRESISELSAIRESEVYGTSQQQPVPEEDTNLPELVIERVSRRRGYESEDETPEFYDYVTKRVRKYYRVIFNVPKKRKVLAVIGKEIVAEDSDYSSEVDIEDLLAMDGIDYNVLTEQLNDVTSPIEGTASVINARSSSTHFLPDLVNFEQIDTQPMETHPENVVEAEDNQENDSVVESKDSACNNINDESNEKSCDAVFEKSSTDNLVSDTTTKLHEIPKKHIDTTSTVDKTDKTVLVKAPVQELLKNSTNYEQMSPILETKSSSTRDEVVNQDFNSGSNITTDESSNADAINETCVLEPTVIDPTKQLVYGQSSSSVEESLGYSDVSNPDDGKDSDGQNFTKASDTESVHSCGTAKSATDTSGTTSTEDGKVEIIVVEALVHPPKNIASEVMSTSDGEIHRNTDQDDILNVAIIESDNSVENTDHSTVKIPETTQIVHENIQESPRDQDQDDVRNSKCPSPSTSEKILNWHETHFMTGSDSSSFDLDDPRFQNVTVRQKLNNTVIERPVSCGTCNSDDTDITEDERESTNIAEGSDPMDITLKNKERSMGSSSPISYTEFVQVFEGCDKNQVAPHSHSDGTSRENKPDEDTERNQRDISQNLEDPEEQDDPLYLGVSDNIQVEEKETWQAMVITERTDVEQMRGQQEDVINSTLHEDIIHGEEVEEITAPNFGRHSLEQADDSFTVEDTATMQVEINVRPSSQSTNTRKRALSSNDFVLSKRTRNNENTTPTHRTVEIQTDVIEEIITVNINPIPEREDAAVEDATTQTYPSMENIGVQANIQNEDERRNENQRPNGWRGNHHSEISFEFFLEDGTVRHYYKFRKSGNFP